MGNVISDLAEGGAKGLFSGIGSLVKDIRTAWTGKPPEYEQKLLEFEQKIAEMDQALAQGQIEINKIEAQSENLFKSGWRPFIGWVCGFALVGQFIVFPFVSSFVKTPDWSQLITLLLALLGMGTLRSFDKGSFGK